MSGRSTSSSRFKGRSTINRLLVISIGLILLAACDNSDDILVPADPGGCQEPGTILRGDFQLTSQAQVDSLRGVASVDGRLIIATVGAHD